MLLTQNVDRLHQAAGSRVVIDLHVRLYLVGCMACSARADFQDSLMSLNAEWADQDATVLPDGDAELVHQDFSSFAVPPCASCGGLVKPDVVFFRKRRGRLK
jgi:NAD-dependent SIR2 family protein deacetylase